MELGMERNKIRSFIADDVSTATLRRHHPASLERHAVVLVEREATHRSGVEAIELTPRELADLPPWWQAAEA